MDKIELLTALCDHAAAMMDLQVVMMEVIEQAKEHVSEETWKKFTDANQALLEIDKKLKIIMKSELH